MAAPRQTATFLRRRLREAGVQPDRRHGQNFLIDLNLIDLLAASARLEQQDIVLEVGTGMGSLTRRMAPLAGQIVTVEIDENLAQLANEQLDGFENVTLLQQDVLRNKNNIDDKVLEAVRASREEVPGGQFKLVANLPYNIATPLISNLLHWAVPPILMAVTIQKELAQRMMAVPSTKEYSALSIWIQSLAEVELIRELPPSVFWPRPKVDSAIIRILTKPEKFAAIPDLAFYHTFVRALFFHRRKFLRSVLISAFKHQLQKQDVDDVLFASPLHPEMRAEQLNVAEVQELCEAFRQRIQSEK